MRTTQPNSDPSLQQASTHLASAQRAEREGLAKQAYVEAEHAAAFLNSYVSRKAIALNITPAIAIYRPTHENS